MQSTQASRFVRFRSALGVPMAAIACGGLALALFTSGGAGPARSPSVAQEPPPLILAEPNVRKIEMPRVASVPETPGDAPEPVAPPAVPPSGAGPLIREAAQAPAKVAGTSQPRRASAPRASTEPPRATREPRAVQPPVKVVTRPAPVRPDPGVLDRTLALGSQTVGYAVGGVDSARSAAVGLGRTVVVLIGDLIP